MLKDTSTKLQKNHKKWKKCNFAGGKNKKKCNTAMLYRKISSIIEAHLRSGNAKKGKIEIL